MSALLPVVLALPVVAGYAITAVRASHSRSLDELPASPPLDGPSVSLVIPARNEARNIARCVRSALAADYPRLEVIVVDDHSTDGTGEAAREAAGGDVRLRVTTPEPLPLGWFGKQWACAHGARLATGEVLGFLDADTWQSPDLVPRVVRAIADRRADLLTVAGTQELGSFWERLIQPQVFSVLLSRFGGTESVNGSRSARQKIANGQCLFITREAYDSVGGHASVRDKVAEDLALAQRFFAEGRTVTLVLGVEQLYTRMYTSLAELAEGWGKNIYAGGRDAMPLGAFGRAVFPLLLLTPWLAGLVPPLALALALAGVLGDGWLIWSATVTGANLVWWLLVYRWLRLSPAYALLHPLGAAVLLWISARAVLRGRRVRWKEREYLSA